jgi:hypothetical protein
MIRFVCLATALLVLAVAAHAQPITSGTEFVFAIPYNDGSQFAADSDIEIYVSSAYDRVRFTVTDGSGNSRTFRTSVAGSIMVINRTTWQVIDDSLEVKQSESETVLNKSLRIVAEQPVTVSVLNARAVSSDAWRPMPLHHWGKVHRAVSYWDFREFGGTSWAGGFVVVAGTDNTAVQIVLGGETDGAATTVKGRAPGQTINVTLNKGQVYAVIGDGTTRGTFDLTGSLITSSEPVSVIGFHARTVVPSVLMNGNGRDHLVENIPPVHAWSTDYVTTSLQRASSNGQGKGDVFRIVAHENNTTWTMKYYDRTTGQLLGQDGGMLAAGKFRTIEAASPTILPHGVVVVSANKPIFLMQYSTSSSFDGAVNGDPFMVGVQGSSQFVQTAAFQTPTIDNYDTHYLNLVVHAPKEDDAKSLTLDGVPIWDHAAAQYPPLLSSKVPRTDDMYTTVITLGSGSTAHVVEANEQASFAGYLHGVGALDSYGTPVAGMQRIVATTDTIKPVITTTTTDEEIRADVTDAGGSGLESVLLLPASRNARLVHAADPIPTYPVVTPLNSVVVTVHPVSCNEEVVGILQARDHSGNVRLDTVHRREMTLLLPELVDMGATEPGTVIEDSVSIRNYGADTLVINNVKGFYPYGPSNGLTITTSGWPRSIPPGDSTYIGVRYAPLNASTDGSYYDSMLVVLNECDELTFITRGRSSASEIRVVDNGPAAQEVAIGSTRCDSNCIVVQNVSAVPVNIVSVSATQHDEITVTNMPMIEFVLAPGETKVVGTVCYSPTNAGPDSTAIRVGTASNAWNTLIRRRAPITSSVNEPLQIPDDVTIENLVVHARENSYTVTVYDLLGRTLFTGTVRPGEPLTVVPGYVVFQKP